MHQLSIDQVKKISPEVLLKLIQRAKDFLKKNDVIKEMCKTYDITPDFIDLVPMKFGDLDVSARTAKGVITLNYKLLCDGDFFNDYHYLAHELEHFCQQCFGDVATQGANEGDYLANPFEQEGFQRQIEYLDHMYGENKAEDYVEHLLDHHDKNGKEREKLEKVLTEKI